MAELSRAPQITFLTRCVACGGAELHLEALLTALGPHWVARVIGIEDGPFATRLRRGGQPVEVVRVGRRLRMLAALPRLRRSLRGSEIIFANGSKAALVAVLATLGTPARVVWYRVDSTLNGVPARLLGRACRSVIGMSRSAVRDLTGRRSTHAHALYPGVELPAVDRQTARSRVRARLGIDPDARVIVHSGRLTESKGQDHSIAACASALSSRRATHLALIGAPDEASPGYAAALRDQVDRLGLSEHITLLGHVGDEPGGVSAAIEFVAGCDLLLSPSVRDPKSGWEEGFGLSVAEALAVGTPVIAYANGSLPEVIGDCGRIVAEGDREALAAAVDEVLASPDLRARMSRCGSERAEQVFSRRVAVARMKELLREAAGGVAAGGPDGQN